MNNELSKALDGAMADAAEMGELEAESPKQIFANLWCARIRNKKRAVIAEAAGRVKDDCARRARLIVESVNGRAAMAKRIADLEETLDQIAQDAYEEDIAKMASAALSAKGGA